MVPTSCEKWGARGGRLVSKKMGWCVSLLPAYPLVFPNRAGWNIPVFDRKYIFKLSPFSSQLLSVYISVSFFTVSYKTFFLLFFGLTKVSFLVERKLATFSYPQILSRFQEGTNVRFVILFNVSCNWMGPTSYDFKLLDPKVDPFLISILYRHLAQLWAFPKSFGLSSPSNHIYIYIFFLQQSGLRLMDDLSS